ncbi:alpha/beta hydrolase family protein [Novosphingobium colocasiae]|uniref:alpha/beta hydrolase family protein n=1 Tax=Novosphingobium colocasiae TaxID=1256513 RepID=UPI0035B237CB
MWKELHIEGRITDACFDFAVNHEGGTIPATFWNARDRLGRDAPLTLLQHGGPFHKRHERSDELARTIVERTGSAVLLIDGPVHGRRRDDTPGMEAMLAAFEAHWRKNPGIEGYVADWRMALDVVLGAGWADPTRIAWFGMSMGTAYGIALCAAEPRIKVAALGMWGMDWGQEASLLNDARKLRTPVLFQIKSGDEIFSTQGQRALFDALGSPDKCLHTFAGGHSLTAPGQLDELLDFITRAFGDDQAGAATRPAGRAGSERP